MNTMTFSVYNNLFSGLYENPTTRMKVLGEKVESEFKNFEQNIIDKSQMSFEAYQEYAYQKISQMQIHPSQKNITYKVTFSIKAIKRMQTDAAYEESVFGTMKALFQDDELTGKGIMYVNFDDKGQGYEAKFVKFQNNIDDDGEKEDFWSKRAKRQREIDEIVFERNKKKKIRDKIIRNQMIEKMNMRNYAYTIRKARALQTYTGEYVAVDFDPIMKESTGLLELLEGLM